MSDAHKIDLIKRTKNGYTLPVPMGTYEPEFQEASTYEESELDKLEQELIVLLKSHLERLRYR